MADMTQDERALVKSLEERLTGHLAKNQATGKYYQEHYNTSRIGVLPDLPSLNRMVVGWGSTVVDVLEERINLLGWSTEADVADVNLADLFMDSGAAAESHQAHTDSLIYGIGFISVTAGGPGEPEVLVRAHSALHSTADVDLRTGLAKSALTKHSPTSQTLWTATEVVEMSRPSEHGQWRVETRTAHGMGRCPVVPLVNRSRAGDRHGRSEITPAIRTAIDSATRALKAMDVNREFYSVPQRYGIGLSADQFAGPDGQVSGWDMAASKMLLAPRDEDGEAPQFGEFSPVSPGPYLEQIRGLAGLVATEAGIPESYLGVSTANPSSADAIRQLEARLVTRAKRRCQMFEGAWSEVGRLAVAILTNTPVQDVPVVRCHWGEPGTPTTAATVDALVKLVQVGSVPADSDLLWEKAGFTEPERRKLRAEMERLKADARMAALGQLINGSQTNAMEGGGANDGSAGLHEADGHVGDSSSESASGVDAG